MSCLDFDLNSTFVGRGSADGSAANLFTPVFKVSFSSLDGLQNDNGEFVLQGVKYSITFIELTVNSTGTAVTSSNEFTWSPISNRINFEGATQRVFEIPPLSIVPYTSSGSGRRLAASPKGGSLLSSGWTSSVTVIKKGGPPVNSNNVSVEVSMNGQDFTASGLYLKRKTND